MREGLIHSRNTITAQLMQRLGPSRVATVAHAMGVRQSKLDQVPSLALGTSPVTLKEMVSAFGSIANGGSYIARIVIGPGVSPRVERPQLPEAVPMQAPERIELAPLQPADAIPAQGGPRMQEGASNSE